MATGKVNAKLHTYLERRISQPTVILCFKVLLENVIKNSKDSGLKKSEIAVEFNRQCKFFGITRFRTDYILRQSGVGNDAIFESDTRFYIEESFLKGMDSEDYAKIITRIENQYQELGAIRNELYKSIHEAQKLPIDKRREFIRYMLLDRETEKKGQSFEVTAYAILKAFYAVRGFELNRFSTIYSNDGGIDYTSQSAVYQVTTLLSNTKFAEDLIKAPLKKRIFVFKNAGAHFDFKQMDNELVTDYISADDLMNHLDYLLLKKPEFNSSLVFQIILQEFEREHYL